MPAATAKIVKTKTRNLFRALASIIRSVNVSRFGISAVPSAEIGSGSVMGLFQAPGSLQMLSERLALLTRHQSRSLRLRRHARFLAGRFSPRRCRRISEEHTSELQSHSGISYAV